ncbi:thioredoxin [Chitinophaga horti]|uniref:Thioredoxin n=1 Tax=Chitinophaga horti TaxID=2920382 RepID=A0ABY6IWN0_9BACT|nr:thioredoxin [Chitinophaga horti]UYQ91785.1 thioredoxin [Chitinophaga horti]
MALTFTDQNFAAEVLQSDKLSVVDFTAAWCGPCRALGTIINDLSDSYAGKVNIGKLDVDTNPEVSVNFGVTNLPTVLFIKGGKVVDKQVGAVPKSVLEKKIQANL